jgi:hypothetical protein
MIARFPCEESTGEGAEAGGAVSLVRTYLPHPVW